MQIYQLLSGLKGRGEQTRNISSPLATITYEVCKLISLHWYEVCYAQQAFLVGYQVSRKHTICSPR